MAHRKFKAPRPQMPRTVFDPSKVSRERGEDRSIAAAHVWRDANGQLRIMVVR